MIKVIMFDLGGVVVNYWNAPYFKYIAKKSKMGCKEVEDLINEPISILEEGAMVLPEFNRMVAERFNIKESDVQWLEQYKKNYTINENLIKLVLELKKNYKTAFLSNVDESRYDYSIDRLHPKAFSYRFASCFIGSSKPDSKIYRYVLKKMKVKASEVIFIDNSVENVKGAERVGIRSLLYTEFGKLKRDLKKIGVIKPKGRMK